MRKATKLLALVLALALCLSIVPITAYAETVTGVDIKVQPAVIGDAPVFKATIPASAHTHSERVVWNEVESGGDHNVIKVLTTSDQFEKGKRYRVDVFFKFESGYNGGGTWTVDSQSGIPDWSGSEKRVSSYFTPRKGIYEVKFELEEPYGGENPDFTATIPEDANFTVESVQWKKGSTVLTETSTFVAGETYSLQLQFLPKSGYAFSANCKCSRNNLNGPFVVYGWDGIYSVGGLSARAPRYTFYDLYIDGRQVHDGNKDDVLGNQVFTYDSGKNILYLKKSYTTPLEKKTIIENKIKGLTIQVNEDLTLYAETGNPIATSADLTITGPGKLTLVGKYLGLTTSGTGEITVTLKNLKISAVATIATSPDKGWAICGNNYSEKLVLDNCALEATGAAAGISGFGKGIELNDCEIAKPEGGKVLDGSVVDKDEKVAGHVEIKATGAPITLNPFTDIAPGKWYYAPVLWAYYHTPQITGGTSPTTFSPNATCTRAQMVAFLWRAQGCPEPTLTENPFSDVAATAYYYKAVLWAVEKGITKGTTDTTFSPNNFCRREHAVAFLYRTAGSPGHATTVNPFSDVKETAYYYDAVLWAVEKSITKGTSSTTFSPKGNCKRCEIVTFLYRYMNPA